MNLIFLSSLLLMNSNAIEDFSPFHGEKVFGQFPAGISKGNSTEIGASAEGSGNVGGKSWHLPIGQKEIGKIWPPKIDLGDNFPWNSDFYHPRNNKFISEYGDYYSAITSPNLASFNGDASLHEIDQAIGPRKQDYFAIGGNYGKPEMRGFGESATGYRKAEHVSKNACRQYLEFLKYAFESLDKAPENRRERVNDYRSDYGGKTGRDETFSDGKHFGFKPYERPSTSGKFSRVDEIRGENAETSIAIPPSTMSTKDIFFASIATATPASSAATHQQQQQHIAAVSPSTIAIGQAVKGSMFPATRNRTESPETSSAAQGFGSTYGNFEMNRTNSTETKRTGSPERLFPDGKQKNAEPGTGKGKTPSAVVTTDFPEGRRVYSGSTVTKSGSTTKRKHLEVTTIRQSETDAIVDECNDKMLPCPDTFNITYPLNGYCNRFVSCESGRAIRRACPKGLYFNVVTKTCDLPHNSFCNYACPAANGYYGIPGDCGGYFVCENSFPVYNLCPPKMHWSNSKEICTFAEWSDCPMKCSTMNEIKRYEGDCKAYVVCMNWFPYYHKCPPNTVFDEIALTCVLKHLSDCEDDPKLMTNIMNPFFVMGNE